MIETAFNNLLAKIGVSQSQRSQGSTSHNHIRSILDSKREYDSSFPWLTSGDFISGSYARETKIHPLDDIDVMMVIDGTGLHVISEGRTLDAEVRGDGDYGNPVAALTYGQGGLISSRKVLELFRSAIKESYPNSDIRKSGQAVNVWLESYGLGIDIVPCFHIIPRNEEKDFYYIPRGTNSDEWMTTNPKIDEEICDIVNERHDKKLKGVIRLLNYWNNVHNASRLQSYHLETVALYVFHGHPSKIQDHHTALQYFFNNAAPFLANSCADMTSLGGPVDRYLSDDARRLTMVKLEEVRNIVNVHLSLGSILPGNIIAGWRKIFGNSFGT